jgi:hypothetical protein
VGQHEDSRAPGPAGQELVDRRAGELEPALGGRQAVGVRGGGAVAGPVEGDHGEAERGRGLLGLEISGIGLRPHADSDLVLGPLTRGEPPATGPTVRGNLRDALWRPRHLYPDGAAAALPFSPVPGYEGGDVRGWVAAFPGLAARVRVPVRYTLGDHERVWACGPAALAEVAALFTASPRVTTAEQADAGHNLSLGLSALAYHLKVLSFAEECALARPAR